MFLGMDGRNLRAREAACTDGGSCHRGLAARIRAAVVQICDNLRLMEVRPYYLDLAGKSPNPQYGDVFPVQRFFLLDKFHGWEHYQREPLKVRIHASDQEKIFIDSVWWDFNADVVPGIRPVNRKENRWTSGKQAAVLADKLFWIRGSQVYMTED